MGLTSNEVWLFVHGVLLWTIFLVASASGLIGLWNLRPEVTAIPGFQQRMRRLAAAVRVAAIAAWLAVLTGPYVLFPAYRARPSDGVDLRKFPRAYLQSMTEIAGWNDAMEWKQQMAWFAPILATAVACVVARYGERLAVEPEIRRALVILFAIGILTAAAAAAAGALINKVVSIH
jgi:hypothetical protein